MKRIYSVLLVLIGIGIGLCCGVVISQAYGTLAPKFDYEQVLAQVGETKLTRGVAAEHALAQIGDQILSGDVQRMLVIEELARQRNITVSAAEIQQRVKEAGDYVESLRPGGRELLMASVAPWLLQERIRSDMLLEKLMGLTLTESEVENFYAGNPLLYYQPSQVKLICVSVSDETTAKRVISRLKNGEDPKVVSMHESTDPLLRQSQGEIGWIAQASFANPDAVDAIFGARGGKGLQPKQFTGIINNSHYNMEKKPEYLVYYVVDRKEAYRPKFAEVRAHVTFVARDSKISNLWPQWFREHTSNLTLQQIEPGKLFEAGAPLVATPITVSETASGSGASSP